MGRYKEFNLDDVLDQSVNVFWKNGYADTSITDIERATGLNKSSIYHEFTDKGGLFVSSLKYYVERYSPVQILMKAPLGWKNIEELFMLVAHKKDEKGCFASYCLREYAILPEEANQVVKDFFASVKQAFEKNLKADGFADAPIIAEMILTFLLGINLERTLTVNKKIEFKLQKFLSTMYKLGKQ